MKRYLIHILWTAILVPAFLSCTREGMPATTEEQVVPDNSNLITATFESSMTKANINQDTGVLTWQADDRIAVWTKEAGYLCGELTSGAGEESGTFAVPLHGMSREGYAVFPESIANEALSGTGGSSLGISLPNVIRLNTSADGWNNKVQNPMVAVNQPGQPLQFKHVCAMVRLTLTNVPSTTRFIRVSSSRTIAGNFTVDTSDPATPFITSDGTEGNGDLSYVLYWFPTTVSGTVTVNLPVPAGLRYNLIVSTHPEGTSYSVQYALRPDGESSAATSRFSIEGDWDYERGKGYLYELDCSTGVAYSMDTFSVPDATLYILDSPTNLSWSIERNNSNNNLYTVEGLIVDSYAEDPEIVKVEVVKQPDTFENNRPVIRVSGLKLGSTRLVTTIYCRNQSLKCISNITVKSRGYHVSFRSADKILTGGAIPLTAFFRRDGQDYSNNVDTYEWVITSGANLASFEDHTASRYKWLRAGNQEGTITVVCKAVLEGQEVVSNPHTIRIMEDAPYGAIRGLYSVDIELNNVFFAPGNLFYDAVNDKYTFFDTQIGYYLARERPAGKPNTQEKADLFNEDEVPIKWHDNPMNHNRIYSDFDSDDYTTGWSGLRISEWEYILKSRRGITLNGVKDARYARVSITNDLGRNIRCIMLLPDGYIHPDGIPLPVAASINSTNNTTGYNLVYTMDQMYLLQDEGVVFLPQTGTYEDDISGTYKKYRYNKDSGGYDSFDGGLYYAMDTGQTNKTETGSVAKGFYTNYGGGENIVTPAKKDTYFYSIRLIRRN